MLKHTLLLFELEFIDHYILITKVDNKSVNQFCILKWKINFSNHML